MSEKTRTTVSPNHATFHNTVTDFISKSMSRWVGEKWRNYKFRFVPWIMLNLKKEIKVMHRTDTPFKPNDTYIAELWHLLGEFQRPDLNCIFKPSLRRSMFLDLHNENNQILLRLKGKFKFSFWIWLESWAFSGFSLVVKPSQSHGAGFGVFVSSGRIRAGEMIALYPGTIYEPFHPILIQSVRNPYILRCSDGKWLVTHRVSSFKFNDWAFAALMARARASPKSCTSRFTGETDSDPLQSATSAGLIIHTGL